MKNKEKIAARKEQLSQSDEERKVTAKKRLDLKKHQDVIHTRDRAHRKALFQAAKDADEELGAVCTKYHEAARLEFDSRRKLQKMRENVNKLELDAKDLDNKIKTLQLKWRAKRTEYGKAKVEMTEFAVNLTVMERLKRGVQESWSKCQNAWEQLNRAIVKKHRNRDIKRVAKDILKEPK